MANCPFCGFDGLEEGQTCAVCGADASTMTRVASAADGSTAIAPASAQSQPSPSIFAERYIVDAMVGRGGMGAVFRVRDHTDGATRALKILHAGADVDQSALRRFRREAEILGRINHPSIPRIYDSGVRGRQMYLVTDFIEGDSLRSAIRKRGAFPIDEAARIAIAIAECLDVAHAHGVIHRDIKPHNVMLSPGGAIWLLDFGIARDVGIKAESITGTGVLVGTPEYMSPEQFQGAQVDGRSDIYSLGVLLFQLATGTLPFVADTPVSFAIKHTQEPPPNPRAIRAEIPMWMARIILRCMEKEPRNRYATAGDIAADLRKSPERKRTVSRLPNGDFIVHDDTTDEEWALIIAAAHEKTGEWSIGNTIQYGGTFYKLARVDVDETFPAPFVYRFAFWPESEVFRRVVDYEPEARTPATSQGQISGKLKKLFGRN
ncbi:MAG: serine/threonine-protein kinase [Thermoanaerobaculia bacterium]